jgi:hypothetical protein
VFAYRNTQRGTVISFFAAPYVFHAPTSNGSLLSQLLPRRVGCASFEPTSSAELLRLWVSIILYRFSRHALAVEVIP